MTQIGSYDISILLAAKRTSVKEFGEVKVNEILQADLAAWNTIAQNMLGDLCEFSTDAMRWYGRSANNDMSEVDEYGRSPSVVVGAGYNIGFPLKRFEYVAGFTRRFLESATVADLAQRQLDAKKAHKKQLYAQIRKALMKSTNPSGIRDHLVDNVSLQPYRLVNADSNPIPDGPFGDTFTASTHTHYTSSGSFTNQVLLDVVNNVIEHGHDDGVMIYINRAQEAAVLGFADTRDAVGISADRQTYSTSTMSTVNRDFRKYDDVCIGTFHDAEVWKKPWIPENYILCFAAGDARKPLVFRQENASSLQGLRLAAELDTHPLLAEVYEATFGLGVWERTNGVVHYIGADAWTDPTV